MKKFLLVALAAFTFTAFASEPTTTAPLETQQEAPAPQEASDTPTERWGCSCYPGNQWPPAHICPDGGGDGGGDIGGGGDTGGGDTGCGCYPGVLFPPAHICP